MARMMDWIDTRIGLNVANAAVPGFLAIDGGSTQVVQRGTTIIRTIIALYLSSDDVAGAWGVQDVDLAIGISDREAFTAGVLPDPNSNTDKPARGWMWRTALMVSQNGVGGQVVFEVHADVRGARKLDLGRAYIIMTSLTSAGTVFDINLRGLIRTLIKLP
jgi:hypothetical protein